MGSAAQCGLGRCGGRLVRGHTAGSGQGAERAGRSGLHLGQAQFRGCGWRRDAGARRRRGGVDCRGGRSYGHTPPGPVLVLSALALVLWIAVIVVTLRYNAPVNELAAAWDPGLASGHLGGATRRAASRRDACEHRWPWVPSCAWRWERCGRNSCRDGSGLPHLRRPRPRCAQKASGCKTKEDSATILGRTDRHGGRTPLARGRLGHALFAESRASFRKTASPRRVQAETHVRGGRPAPPKLRSVRISTVAADQAALGSSPSAPMRRRWCRGRTVDHRRR